MPRRYHIKEIFHTLQGEGAQSGRAAIFCRFTGCNLWSGLEKDRASAKCRFCDTDFVGTNGTLGGSYSAEELAEVIARCWAEVSTGGAAYVVFTGGEPLLQLDSLLIQAVKEAGFEIAIETNGTRAVPAGVDWVCVSPKPRSECVVMQGNELKLIFPQPEPEMHPSHFSDWAFEYFYLQPMDGPNQAENIQAAITYCQHHPQWRLSLQNHKIIGLR